jgi:hypothetical protein
MKKVLVLLLMLSACGADKRRQQPVILSEQVQQRVADIRAWAPLCDNYISKGSCDQGDVMAFSGYLCLAEEPTGCSTARASFDIDGRGWRNPKHEPLGEGNSFSRDMLLGALYYFAATKDVQAEANFRSYVKRTGRLCDDATDNRCEMTPGMWGLWGEVAGYIGNEPTDTMRINMLLDDKQLYLQSLTSPAGYQQELVAMEIILRRYISRNSKLLEWSSAKLYDKNKNNPLYEYLENGCTDKFFEQFIQLSPAQEPAEKRNWTIAKDNLWSSSMGWEWIFLAKMCSSTNTF